MAAEIFVMVEITFVGKISKSVGKISAAKISISLFVNYHPEAGRGSTLFHSIAHSRPKGK